MRQSLLYPLGAVLLVALAVSCRPKSDPGAGDSHTQTGSANDEPSKPPLVIFDLPGNKRVAVLVEIARTRPQITKGLMHRRTLEKNSGMLFLMNEERVHSFYMRNTYVPLDMIFIARDKTVAGIVANTTPLTEDSRTIAQPSFYVLEVNAGWAKQNGVKAGTKLRFKNIRE